MKQLRLSLFATILTLALATSTLAGHMATGVASPPPPDPTVSADGHMATGFTSTGDTSGGETSASSEATSIADPVTEITLNLLQSLLSLF